MHEGGIRLPLGDQESVSCDTERHVVVKATPTSPFVMIEPKFLFEFLIITLDPPAQFGLFDERRDGRVRRQGRKPIFDRLLSTLGPFDEKPLLGMRHRAPIVAMSRPNPNRGETRAEIFIRAFAPCDLMPSIFGERHRQLFGRHGFVLRIASQERWRSSLARPCLRRQRTGPRRPEARGGLNANNVGQAHLRQCGSERRIDPITGVGQNDAIRHTFPIPSRRLLRHTFRLTSYASDSPTIVSKLTPRPPVR